MEPHGNKVKIRHKIMSALPGIGKYTAGPYPIDSVKAAVKLSKEGFDAITNSLGEHDTDPQIIKSTVQDYEDIIEEIRKNKKGLMNIGISIKPTQFGFHEVDADGTVAKRIMRIMKMAIETEIFVWMDMEGHTTTDFTVSLYKSAIEILDSNLIGIALQANLFRTEKDLRDLIDYSKKKDVFVHVRLVRGIYKEPEEIACTKKEDMHNSLAKLIYIAFSENAPKVKVSIGSHHPIQIIRGIAMEKKFPGKLYDFQFLYGAAKKIPKLLKELNYHCTYYTPAGPRFFRYGIRRIKENPGALAGLIFNPIFEGKNLSIVKKYIDGKLEVDTSKKELPVSEKP